MFSLHSEKTIRQDNNLIIRLLIRFFVKKIKSLSALSLILIFFVSCEEESLQNIVVTEDVLYISGDVVSITGRVIEIKGAVDDHGFQIDDNSDFSSPLLVSMGAKADGLGRFIGEFAELEISTNYYFRSYINVGGEESVGQTKEFRTLYPRIESYQPQDGIEGNSLSVYGNNFTKDSKVMFGDKEAEIVAINSESEIIVKVPPLTDDYSVEVKVVVQDTTMAFKKPFNYHFGVWEFETQFFDETQLYETAWIKDGNDFVFGLGAPDRFSLNNKFWKLDLTDYSWVELAYPGADFSTSRLPFNSGLYWGSGDANFDFGENEPSAYFWKYNNGIFEQQSFLPFQLIMSVGHHLNDQLLVFGGQRANFTINTNVYRYDENLDSWDVVSIAPIEIVSEYPSFSYNNKAYFLQPDGQIWQFDPVTDSWTVATTFFDDVKKYGVAVVLNGKAYIGMFEAGKQLWEWDIDKNSWLQKSSYPGTGVRDINTAAFAHDNKIFFFRSKYDGGSFDQNPRMELWSHDPNQLK